MCYYFRSKVGTFSIVPDDCDPDMFQLCIGGFWLGTFEKAEGAVNAVYSKTTGWADWDKSDDSEGPDDLSGWDSI